MTINAGDIASYQLNSGKRDRLLLQARATVPGAGGVLTQPLTWLDDPGITAVRGASAGLYNLTFPKSADGQGSISVQTVSAAGTVRGGYVVAADFAAGTAQIQTVNAAGAATDPAATDSFIVTLLVDTRKDF
jgi:hypothetical protein